MSNHQASPVAQGVKNLPAMQETWVRFLGWEDPLEEEMATHSSIRAWKSPWTEEPGRLQSMGKESDMTERLTHTINNLTQVCLSQKAVKTPLDDFSLQLASLPRCSPKKLWS